MSDDDEGLTLALHEAQRIGGVGFPYWRIKTTRGSSAKMTEGAIDLGL